MGWIAGGIVFIVLGIIILFVSTLARSYSSEQTAQCSSLTGMLGQALSNEQEQACKNAVLYQGVSVGGQIFGGALAIIGVIIAAAGGILKARGSGFRTTDYMNKNEGEIPFTKEGKIFCRYCGKLRPVAGTLCSECSKPTVSAVIEVKQCHYCMASMSNDSEFCANCGRKF